MRQGDDRHDAAGEPEKMIALLYNFGPHFCSHQTNICYVVSAIHCNAVQSASAHVPSVRSTYFGASGAGLNAAIIG